MIHNRTHLAVIAMAAMFPLGIFLSFIGSLHRENLGGFHGNILINMEIVIFACAVWKKTIGKNVAISHEIYSWIAVIFFAFFAWFLHPSQEIARAENRLSDYERDVDALKIEGMEKISAEKSRRISAELSARQQEYEAALTRYNGSPDYGYSYLLGACSALAAMAGMYMRKKAKATLDLESAS